MDQKIKFSLSFKLSNQSIRMGNVNWAEYKSDKDQQKVLSGASLELFKNQGSNFFLD